MSDLPYQTLHCHTVRSDGLLTPQQVLDECAKNKIGVVAFTDHDSLADPKSLEDLKKINHPVKFISGIEISCDVIKEFPEKIQLFHVTGLFVDPTNHELKAYADKQPEYRRERMRKFVKKLNDLGFKVTEEQILKYSQGQAVARPHMVSALEENSENFVLLEKFYEELKELAKTDPFRKKQVEEIEAREEKQKWYVLVMTKESLHSVYADYHEEDPVNMDEAVRLIRGAGGIALLAHWSYMRDKLDINFIEKLLKEDRLDGMETVYAFGIERNREIFEKDMEDLSNLCEKYGKVQGGGGDFHKTEDFTLMVNPNFINFAERTKGLIENIKSKHPNLDLTWSTLD